MVMKEMDRVSFGNATMRGRIDADWRKDIVVRRCRHGMRGNKPAAAAVRLLLLRVSQNVWQSEAGGSMR